MDVEAKLEVDLKIDSLGADIALDGTELSGTTASADLKALKLSSLSTGDVKVNKPLYPMSVTTLIG